MNVPFILFLCLTATTFSSQLTHDEVEFPTEDIIELPIGRFPEPDCKYSVHHRNKNGPRITSDVHVGDEVFHSWECNYGRSENSLFCLMVHNCTVSSYGDGPQNVEIVDEFGCSLFPRILPHVSYDGDLSAGLLLHAFSLDVDKASVHFSCNVKMLLKLNGVCRRPICQPLETLLGDGRSRRATKYSQFIFV